MIEYTTCQVCGFELCSSRDYDKITESSCPHDPDKYFWHDPDYIFEDWLCRKEEMV